MQPPRSDKVSTATPADVRFTEEAADRETRLLIESIPVSQGPVRRGGHQAREEGATVSRTGFPRSPAWRPTPRFRERTVGPIKMARIEIPEQPGRGRSRGILSRLHGPPGSGR